MENKIKDLILSSLTDQWMTVNEIREKCGCLSFYLIKGAVIELNKDLLIDSYVRGKRIYYRKARQDSLEEVTKEGNPPETV